MKVVKPPINNISNKVNGVSSNRVEHLISKNTPAVTIVAACNNAETGVGPSIASGNQVCKPNWADLPTAPTKIQSVINVNQVELTSFTPAI